MQKNHFLKKSFLKLFINWEISFFRVWTCSTWMLMKTKSLHHANWLHRQNLVSKYFGDYLYFYSAKVSPSTHFYTWKERGRRVKCLRLAKNTIQLLLLGLKPKPLQLESTTPLHKFCWKHREFVGPDSNSHFLLKETSLSSATLNSLHSGC